MPVASSVLYNGSLTFESPKRAHCVEGGVLRCHPSHDATQPEALGPLGGSEHTAWMRGAQVPPKSGPAQPGGWLCDDVRPHRMDSLMTSGYCSGTERSSALLTSTARCFMYSPKSSAPAAGRATSVSAVL